MKLKEIINELSIEYLGDSEKMELAKHLAVRLLKEDEQRAQGCEYCNNEEPIYYQNDSYYNYDSESVESEYNPIYVKDTNYDYCPKCGRRLKVKDND